MKIIFTPDIAVKLQTFARLYPREFSGFGFVEREGETLTVYDIVLLDVGSEVYTEIGTQKVLDLMKRQDADKMKLWFHRHPIDFWSGTDEHTIQTAPLGGMPELVRWSASVVLTPRGWIGRVDNHITHRTAEATVTPDFTEWAQENLDAILSAKAGKDGKWVKITRARKPFSTTRYVQGRFANDELDPDWEQQWPDDEELDEALEALAEEEEVEAEIVETEEEYDLSPYERDNSFATRQNSNLKKSAWFKRLFQR